MKKLNFRRGALLWNRFFLKTGQGILILNSLQVMTKATCWPLGPISGLPNDPRHTSPSAAG